MQPPPTAARPWRVARAAALFFAMAGAASRLDAQSSAPDVPALAAIAPERLDEAIRAAIDYLVGAVQEDGSFVYRIHLDPEVEPKPRYNMLRHGGTMYALAMARRARPEDERIAPALAESAAFLRSQIDEVPGTDGLAAVWSRPEVNHSGSPLQAKLGGTGLALVALCSLEESAPGSTPLPELRALGRFLVFMQKPDGSFYSKFIPDAGGRDDSWTSLYYPGEAALGLVRLYELDRDRRWLDSAALALGYLARSRAGQRDVEADHWALLATARLLPHYDAQGEGKKPPVPRLSILHHARQVCESILREQLPAEVEPRLRGGFAADGRTTPTATRVEGLLATLDFLPAEQGELRGRIEAAAAAGIEFLLRAQVRGEEHRGALPRSVLPASDERAGEVRIDYVQHALSAFLQAEELARHDHDAAPGEAQSPAELPVELEREGAGAR